jgi:O-antigen ligase
MKKNKFFLAIYGATSIIFIEFVGRLMLAEIIALVNLPFINIKKLFKQYKELKVVLSFLAVLLTSLILSDIINISEPADFLRGWSLVIFAMISTIYFVHHLSKNPNAIIYYLVALFVIKMIFGEGDLSLSQWESNTNYFKVRFVGFLNPLIILIGYYLYTKNKKQLGSILFLIFGIICIAFDARSNSLIFIVSSFVLYFRTTKIKFNRARIIRFGLISIIILYVSYVFYVDQVLNHNLGGSNARTQLSMTSNPYNPLELIYYGRSEFFLLFSGINTSPLWGSGSWAKFNNSIYDQVVKIYPQKNNDFPEYVNPHSIFLGTWFWSGIIGFIAIFLLFIKLFKYYVSIYIRNNLFSLMPILTVLFIDFIWAYFFSPIGSLRTSFPLIASMLITLNKK